MKIVTPKLNVGQLNKEELQKIKENQEKHKGHLRIPRRPIWKDSDMDAQTLQQKERDAFLDWRRNLAAFVFFNKLQKLRKNY